MTAGSSFPSHRAYADDFARVIVTKDHTVAHRLLATADIALSFARALVAKDYETAHGMLDAELKCSFSLAILEQKLGEMIRYSDSEDTWPTCVEVMTGADATDMDTWIGKKPEDFGWAYVAIEGIDYSEAVEVVVAQEGERLAIREIVWGRP